MKIPIVSKLIECTKNEDNSIRDIAYISLFFVAVTIIEVVRFRVEGAMALICLLMVLTGVLTILTIKTKNKIDKHLKEQHGIEEKKEGK